MGNTSPHLAYRRAWPVHPHSRGEYCERVLPHVPHCGSPPLAWGIRAGQYRLDGADRFTPTRVGNTPSHIIQFWQRSVHPHSRGEYHARASARKGNPGSPPLAWGIPPARLSMEIIGRFTPTRVGNTQCRVMIYCTLSVHPHSRGEYSTIGVVLPAADGSPPLAWGIRGKPPNRWMRSWFTPTRVGNTRIGQGRIVTLPVHPHSRGEYSLRDRPVSSYSGSPPLAWGIQVALLA